MAKNPILGRGLSYPARLGSDGNLKRDVDDTNTVQSGISIIVLSEIGSRPMRRAFGSRLGQLKHEPNNSATWSLVQSEVQAALDRWEPRIKNIAVFVEPDQFDRFRLNISVSYQIIQTNVVENIVFPFFLEQTGA